MVDTHVDVSYLDKMRSTLPLPCYPLYFYVYFVDYAYLPVAQIPDSRTTGLHSCLPHECKGAGGMGFVLWGAVFDVCTSCEVLLSLLVYPLSPSLLDFDDQ